MKKYILLNKAIFFPEKGILAIADLHIGYEQMLKENGLTFPLSQLEETKKEIREIIKKLKSPLKKIILLGDVKHYFPYEKKEKFEIKELIGFLEEFVPLKKIKIISGNHEKVKLNNLEYSDFILEKEIFFTHGDKLFKEIENKKIKYLVIGHLHPAIILKEGIKKEKYKCFLTGKWKGKKVIVLPSFLSINEGTQINEIKELEKEFSIIPIKEVKKFKVHIIGKEKVYDFGKLNNIKRRIK
jgi:uncharacterized protein